MHELVGAAKPRRCVDRDHHGPFKTLGAVHGDEFDRILRRITASFGKARLLLPIVLQVTHEGLQPGDVVGTRLLDQRVDVGEGARAAVAMASR